jgi:hypothetical protein
LEAEARGKAEERGDDPAQATVLGKTQDGIQQCYNAEAAVDTAMGSS